ncbi:cation channel sperm-associated auxiliary subunit gamma-like [Engraulis encrasicolus]|uniref:cation channel sperm-associated auxiliary subunit gamma-like n=1 Tax=Engraulis encrasicolus TaxID=184585 RepID=UPI002FD6002C
MDFPKTLFFLTLVVGVTGVLVTRCRWTGKLCELGNPSANDLQCYYSLHSTDTASGGMEKQELVDKVDPIIKSLQYIPLDTENTKYFGFPYYLRIDLDCPDHMTGMPPLAYMTMGLLTGLSPVVYLTIGPPVKPTLIKPQRLELILNTGTLSDLLHCASEMCSFGWYAPMPVLNGSVVYGIKIKSNGFGKVDVKDTSYSINVNGLRTTSDYSEDSFGIPIPLSSVMSAYNTYEAYSPMLASPDHSPVMIIPGIKHSKAVLFTASQFKHSQFVEVGIKNCWVSTLQCRNNRFEETIREAVVLESTLIIRQNGMLHRFLGDYTLLPLTAQDSNVWVETMRSVCVKRMVFVPTAHGGKEFFYVLGDGNHQHTLFRADIEDGELTFKELRDTAGNVCFFLARILGAYQGAFLDCVIKTVCQRGDIENSDIVVVDLVLSSNNWITYVVFYKDNMFHLQGRMPQFVPIASSNSFILDDGYAPDSNQPVFIHGVAYSPYSQIIYFWGTVLVCSLDEGRTFMFLRGLENLQYPIMDFSFSYHGEFVFVTATLYEVWWGQEGLDRVVRLRPSYGWSLFTSMAKYEDRFSRYQYGHKLLTVYWDSNKKLQEVVYINATGEVLKRDIPVADINAYNSVRSAPITGLSFGFFTVGNPCPFEVEYVTDLPLPDRYTRVKRYRTRPPLMPGFLGLHTTASLATYHGLLHHILKLHVEYMQDIGDPAIGPVSRFWAGKMDVEDFYSYVASNANLQVNIEMDIVSRVYDYATSALNIPREIYLDLGESYSFSIFISGGVPSDASRENIDVIWISVECYGREYVHIEVNRQELYKHAAVLHQVSIQDRGKFGRQVLAGKDLQTVTVILKASECEDCFQQSSDGIVPLGIYTILVYIGCPPGKRLAFDISKTILESTRLNKRYFDCPVLSSSPCFYYEDKFYPFFLIQDMVLGESGPFFGSYTFKIVGGGAYSRDNIRYYNQEEILMYNSVNMSKNSLIWVYGEQTTVLTTNEGFPVLSDTRNSIRWVCQVNSPCGDLVAQGLMAPDFYFIIEVSNKFVGFNSYCDYALRFEIHVHGFPLSPSRTLYYFLISLGIINGVLFCYVVFHCCGPGVKSIGQAALEAVRQQPEEEDEESDTYSDTDIGPNY